MKTILLIFVLLLSFACTKKRLKETTIVLNGPVDQQVYHKNDTVFIRAEVSYKKEPNNIGFFVALDTKGKEGDSTFFTRTILPINKNYTVSEYYVNEFAVATDITLSYGKRNVKSNQIYEIKTLDLTFLP